MSVEAVDAVALREAIHAGELVPWYQPFIDLAGGAIIGVEALARWHSPAGLIPPAEFVPLAEDSDLVIELDLAIIRQALTDLARWQRLRPGFHLSVNMSGRHLDSASGVGDLIAAIGAAEVTPGTVCVELTETARPVAADTGAPQLDALRQAGIAVWLDDFGSGYYDLRDLIRLPVDGIKFDRSFTAQLHRPRAAPLIGGLTAAAHEMGLKVTLEGIETAEQADVGRRLGCDLGQGFHWSRPIPAAELPGWLSAPRG
ncbi:MAG: EAL domain-containing protein [Micropruina sp.]|uniref:EAL domain-containing protein n=1 Tax=Micropruina sp. TaxID=2737536 RepID=UPI0039E58ADB